MQALDHNRLRDFLLDQLPQPHARYRRQRRLRRRGQRRQDERNRNNDQLEPGRGVQGNCRYLKSSLTERSSWTRRIASASNGATERIFILACCFSGGSGIESVITISSIGE